MPRLFLTRYRGDFTFLSPFSCGCHADPGGTDCDKADEIEAGGVGGSGEEDRATDALGGEGDEEIDGLDLDVATLQYVEDLLSGLHI